MRALPVPMAAISPVDSALAAGAGGCGGEENSTEALRDGHPAPLIPSHRSTKQQGPGEMHGALAVIRLSKANRVSKFGRLLNVVSLGVVGEGECARVGVGVSGGAPGWLARGAGQGKPFAATHEGLVEQNWPLGKNTLMLFASGLLMDTLAVPAVRAQVTAVDSPLLRLKGTSAELHGMRAAGEALSAVAVGVEKGVLWEGVLWEGAGDSDREGVGEALAPGEPVRLGVGEGELESVGPLKLLENCTWLQAAWFRPQPMIAQQGSRMQGTPKALTCRAVVSLR
jgi:hypothetical protein